MEHNVAITHFINPHLFWYRKVGTPGDEYIHVLADLERKLQDLYRNKPSMETRCRPVIGDKVAVNFVAWNKFIRAEVLQTAEFKQEEYIVWTTDYGFPLVTKKEHIRRLPEELQTHPSQVRCGGITNVQPAEVEYDHVESSLIMVKQDQWLQKACEMLEKLLADAASTIFLEKMNTPDDHRWGDLIIVSHKGHKFNASTYLQTAKYAMEVGPEFSQVCSKYKTTKIAPWLTNNRKTNMKYNCIKSNMVEHSHQMTTTLIDEFAKRKVEDWCARNERQQESNTVSDLLLDSGPESAHDLSLDDITFDDSVSVIHKKKMEMEQKAKNSRCHRRSEDKHNEDLEDQVNYIGKAGALTKLKQQKYASKQNLPPQALMQAFDIEPNAALTAPPPDTQEVSPKNHQATTVVSSHSSSTSISSRMQKLAELRAKNARSNMVAQQHNVSSSESSTAISSPSVSAAGGSISLRMKKLAEVRKKVAQCEKEKQHEEIYATKVDQPKPVGDVKDKVIIIVSLFL